MDILADMLLFADNEVTLAYAQYRAALLLLAHDEQAYMQACKTADKQAIGDARTCWQFAIGHALTQSRKLAELVGKQADTLARYQADMEARA